MSKRVLVTGGAGFVGFHVVNKLLETHYQVSILEHPQKDLSHLPAQCVNIIKADILDQDKVNLALQNQDIVIHCAANANLWHKDPNVFHLINAQGTQNIINAAILQHVERFIHVSTDCTMMVPQEKSYQQKAAIQKYLGPYCYSKYLAEEYIRQAVEKGLNASIVNPGVPLGSYDFNQGPFTRTIEAFRQGKIKGFMDGHIWVIDVNDVANGIVTAIEQADIGQSYLLAHERWSIEQLFSELSALLQRTPPKLKVPFGVAYTAAVIEEKICALRNKTPLATTTGLKLARCDIPNDYFEPKLPIQYHSCKEALSRMID